MKKKFESLSFWSLILALSVFALTFFVYHFVTPEGITLVYHEEVGKPFVTHMLGILGILFLFSSITNMMIARIFYAETR